MNKKNIHTISYKDEQDMKKKLTAFVDMLFQQDPKAPAIKPLGHRHTDINLFDTFHNGGC